MGPQPLSEPLGGGRRRVTSRDLGQSPAAVLSLGGGFPEPLPGQRLAGGDAGHDDALGARRGHGFEGSSPELLEELLLALLHAGHGPGTARHGSAPPLSAVLIAVTSLPAPHGSGWGARGCCGSGLARFGAAGGGRVGPSRSRLPFCGCEAGNGAGPRRRPLPGAASRSCSAGSSPGPRASPGLQHPGSGASLNQEHPWTRSISPGASLDRKHPGSGASLDREPQARHHPSTSPVLLPKWAPW